MLFTDNSGTRVLPFTNTSKKCYMSAIIDTESGKNDVLLKVVNKSDTPETIKIDLKGVEKVKRSGHSARLSGSLDVENTLTEPKKVYPSTDNFRAGNSFNYLFPSNSISILRISVVK